SCRSVASGELKGPDYGFPVKTAVVWKILAGVPERAVVRRIDAQCAVVPPAVEVAVLRTGTFDDAGFRFHRSGGVSGRAAGEADTGVNAAAGDAVAEADIAGSVHRRAAHPTIGGIGSKSTLLVQGECGIAGDGGAQFIPPHPYAGAC